MLLNNRVVYKDDTVLTDLSRELSDLNESDKAFAIVAAEDALYIGSDLPFNHRFLSVKSENTQAGTLAVSIWSGTTWEPAVDILDFTAVNGPVPAYKLMDISAGWSYRWLLLEASMNNVANVAYYTRRATGYPGPGIIPGDGRSYYLTVGVKF
jgi:outer membrane receptor protein involved in Fe transport